MKETNQQGTEYIIILAHALRYQIEYDEQSSHQYNCEFSYQKHDLMSPKAYQTLHQQSYLHYLTSPVTDGIMKQLYIKIVEHGHHVHVYKRDADIYSDEPYSHSKLFHICMRNINSTQSKLHHHQYGFAN